MYTVTCVLSNAVLTLSKRLITRHASRHVPGTTPIFDFYLLLFIFNNITVYTYIYYNRAKAYALPALYTKVIRYNEYIRRKEKHAYI